MNENEMNEIKIRSDFMKHLIDRQEEMKRDIQSRIVVLVKYERGDRIWGYVETLKKINDTILILKEIAKWERIDIGETPNG